MLATRGERYRRPEVVGLHRREDKLLRGSHGGLVADDAVGALV